MASPIARVAPTHRQQLATPLARDASAALRGMLNNRLLRPSVSADTATALIDSGYATQALGGLALTDTGNIRAAMETSP